jgi:nitronate monooxygenase
MNFGGAAQKAWKDIWGCGQGIGAVKAVSSTAQFVGRLKAEYDQMKAKLLKGTD